MRICDVLLDRVEQVQWDRVRARHPKMRNAVYIENCFTAMALAMGDVPAEPLVLGTEKQRIFVNMCDDMFGVIQHRDIRAIYPVFFLWCRGSLHEAAQAANERRA
jgi:hypothetical protein